MRFFKRLPPKVSVPAFYLYICLAFVWRFFSSTLFGALLLSILLYVSLSVFGSIPPLSFSELMLWTASLGQDAVVALTSSMLTIVGFLVAFHVASKSWQQQQLAQIKVSAADEVENFFAEASKLNTDTQLYAEELIRTVDRIAGGCSAEEAVFAVQYAQEGAKSFLSKRDRLVSLSIESYRLSSRHSSILLSTFSLEGALEDACAALKEIVDKIWIQVPIVDLQSPTLVEDFMAQVNRQECLLFVCAAKKYSLSLNGSAGFIRGGLLSPVIGFNTALLINLLRKSSAFREVSEHFRNKDG